MTLDQLNLAHLPAVPDGAAPPDAGSGGALGFGPAATEAPADAPMVLGPPAAAPGAAPLTAVGPVAAAATPARGRSAAWIVLVVVLLSFVAGGVFAALRFLK
jgi:hypothetical protein